MKKPGRNAANDTSIRNSAARRCDAVAKDTRSVIAQRPTLSRDLCSPMTAISSPPRSVRHRVRASQADLVHPCRPRMEYRNGAEMSLPSREHRKFRSGPQSAAERPVAIPPIPGRKEPSNVPSQSRPSRAAA